MSDRRNLNFWQKGLLISKTLIFRALIGRAKSVVGHPARFMNLMKSAFKKLKRYNGVGEFTSEAVASVILLLQMLKARASGEYKGLSRKKMFLVVAAIIYFVTPIDIIPDFLPVVGLLDDLSLLAWIYTTLSKEVKEFVQWKNAGSDIGDLSYSELYDMAQEQNIEGRASMRKAELKEVLGKADSE